MNKRLELMGDFEYTGEWSRDLLYIGFVTVVIICFIYTGYKHLKTK